MNQIDLACESFRKLLEEQLLRVSSMKSEKTDFSQKEVITIGIIDGDGIGPIIMEHAVKVLNRLLESEISRGTIVLKHI